MRLVISSYQNFQPIGLRGVAKELLTYVMDSKYFVFSYFFGRCRKKTCLFLTDSFHFQPWFFFHKVLLILFVLVPGIFLMVFISYCSVHRPCPNTARRPKTWWRRPGSRKKRRKRDQRRRVRIKKWRRIPPAAKAAVAHRGWLFASGAWRRAASGRTTGCRILTTRSGSWTRNSRRSIGRPPSWTSGSGTVKVLNSTTFSTPHQFPEK